MSIARAAGTGFVRAKVLVGVGARINGVIVATHVDQGDRVKAGQVMAELQNSVAALEIDLTPEEVAWLNLEEGRAG